MGFPRQEYCSGLPCPPPRDLPDPGIEPTSPVTPAFQVDFLPTELLEKPDAEYTCNKWWVLLLHAVCRLNACYVVFFFFCCLFLLCFVCYVVFYEPNFFLGLCFWECIQIDPVGWPDMQYVFGILDKALLTFIIIFINTYSCCVKATYDISWYAREFAYTMVFLPHRKSVRWTLLLTLFCVNNSDKDAYFLRPKWLA